MKAVFDYTSWPKKSWYPALTIKVVNKKKNKEFAKYKAIVDSGAQGCVFHALIGELIGLNIKSGKEEPFGGVFGTKRGKQYIHRVLLDIEQRWDVETNVGFSYDLRFPFGLLGQNGFLDVFKVCFDFPQKKFDISPVFS